MSIEALKPRAGNPRRHSSRQIRQIAESIKTFGWTNPILADAEGNIIAGAGRHAAAKVIGLARVPVIRIGDMTDAQKRAYVLADNKLAENAGWDLDLLRLELQGLLEMDLGFEVTATGFEMGEIDVLIRGDGRDDAGDDEADKMPAPEPDLAPVTKPDDLRRLGPHRLLCADARQSRSYRTLLGDELAGMTISDPPYNVPIGGHVSGLGAARHPEFAMASGEMSKRQFTGFLRAFLRAMADSSRDGSLHFVFMDWRSIRELLNAGAAIFPELKNICVWTKGNGGMGSLYRSAHELVAVFKKGGGRHINNVDLGRFGRCRTNVWSYPGLNSFGAEREGSLAMHPTVKPVRLVEDAILDCSDRNGLILDAFAGSGTTLIAAERAGRRGFGIEIDPQYVDVALRRFRTLTGIEPVHAATGLKFEDLARDRSNTARSTLGQPDARQGRADHPFRYRSQRHGR